MKMIVTMAGAGKRFRDSGYGCEKYEIPFHGRPLFDWAVVSLRRFFSSDFVFVALDTPGVEPFVRERCRVLGLSDECVSVKLLPAVTPGQMDTALAAEPCVSHDDAVVIYNIDTHVHPDELRPGDVRGDGWIPVFEAPGTRWSFVEADSAGRARRVTEKDRISDDCSVGLYYFKSFGRFRDLAAKHQCSANERYIAPLYNDLIADGGVVRIQRLGADKVLVLGTPEDIHLAESRVSSEPVGWPFPAEDQA